MESFKVDFLTRMRIVDSLLIRELTCPSFDHPVIHVKSVEEFQAIYDLFNKDKISKECLFVAKDLFAYLKTLKYSDGKYLVTNYHVPILEIHVGKINTTYFDVIDIPLYKKKLQPQQSWFMSFLDYFW